VSATAYVSAVHSVPNAEYLLPLDGEFAAAERHRMASSGAVFPALGRSVVFPGSSRFGGRAVVVLSWKLRERAMTCAGASGTI
jgi:hypothetical protein